MEPVTPASEWKAAARKVFVLPSGKKVQLKKLTGEFLFVIQEITEKALVGGEVPQKFTLSPKEQRRYVNALVREAVHLPKLVPDDKTPGDEEMWVSDFGSDLDPLIKEIHEYNKDILVTPFREAPGGEAVPPASPDVRGEPEPVEGAAVGSDPV